MSRPKIKGYERRIEKEVYEKTQASITRMLMEGYVINEIYAEVLTDVPDILDRDFKEMVRFVYDKQKESIHKNREYVFNLHMNRYENIYRKEMKMENNFNHIALDPKKDWNLMVGKYSTALKSLKQKEELLGLHNKDVAIYINEEDKHQIISKLNPIGGTIGVAKMERLSLEEQIELLALLKQCRVGEEDGVRRVVLKENTVQDAIEMNSEVIVDTIYEELPDKVTDKIEEVEILEKEPEPEKPYDPLEAVDRQDPEIVKQARSTTAERGAKVINTNVLKRFEELMKRDKRKKN